MQENLDEFADLDADVYAISVDSPENSKSLKEAGNFTYSFLTDEKMEVLDYVQMNDEGMSFRGFSILDKDGHYVYHQINDHWGEQIKGTSKVIHEQFEKIAK